MNQKQHRKVVSTIIERLKAECERRGLSEAELGRRAGGRSRDSTRRFLTEERQALLVDLIAFAEALELNWRELVGEHTPPPRPHLYEVHNPRYETATRFCDAVDQSLLDDREFLCFQHVLHMLVWTEALQSKALWSMFKSKRETDPTLRYFEEMAGRAREWCPWGRRPKCRIKFRCVMVKDDLDQILRDGQPPPPYNLCSAEEIVEVFEHLYKGHREGRLELRLIEPAQLRTKPKLKEVVDRETACFVVGESLSASLQRGNAAESMSYKVVCSRAEGVVRDLRAELVKLAELAPPWNPADYLKRARDLAKGPQKAFGANQPLRHTGPA